MDALGRSTGSSDPTRSRPRAAPPTVPSATRQARWRHGGSSHRLLDLVSLSLLSQHHSTALLSPKRYDKRYEAKLLLTAPFIVAAPGDGMWCPLPRPWMVPSLQRIDAPKQRGVLAAVPRDLEGGPLAHDLRWRSSRRRVLAFSSSFGALAGAFCWVRGYRTPRGACRSV